MERFNIDDIWAYADTLESLPEHLREPQMQHDSEEIAKAIEHATDRQDMVALKRAVRRAAAISGGAALLCIAQAEAAGQEPT